MPNSSKKTAAVEHPLRKLKVESFKGQHPEHSVPVDIQALLRWKGPHGGLLMFFFVGGHGFLVKWGRLIEDVTDVYSLQSFKVPQRSCTTYFLLGSD